MLTERQEKITIFYRYTVDNLLGVCYNFTR